MDVARKSRRRRRRSWHKRRSIERMVHRITGDEAQLSLVAGYLSVGDLLRFSATTQSLRGTLLRFVRQRELFTFSECSHGTFFRHPDLAFLRFARGELPELKAIDLGGAGWVEQSAVSVVENQPRLLNGTVTTLRLGPSSYFGHTWRAVMRGLAQWTPASLRVLDLSNIRIRGKPVPGYDTWSSLGALLRRGAFPLLEELSVAHVDLGDDGFRTLMRRCGALCSVTLALWCPV
jgi:hypothetical protein